MEHRTLGRTGRELSIIGFGAIVVAGKTQEEANALVREALDRGVTYFDVAPSYGQNQETEKKLGPALEGQRDRIFLACKTAERTRAGAEAELRRSLEHLRTDHFDLYQLHAITSQEDIATIFGPGGAMEAFVAAREAGMVRHLGFSAHSVEAAFAAMDRFDFDSALFPINFVNYFQGHFGPQIVARAIEKGVGRLALKAMARTTWKENADRPFPNCWYEPMTDPYWAELALRFTLSEPITAAIPPGDPRLFRMAMEFGERFRPITDEERAELRQYAASLQPIFQAAA
ncbi:MAG TPA: aldo/keto reductase [Chthonomonadaceae bacterium]|nr:aldo/keto reductase [Chthonomonadaceae bacterium]